MDGITSDNFLTTIFPPDLLPPDERVVIAHPASFISPETGERVDYYRQINYRPGVIRPGEFGWYFCVSSVRAQRQRQVKKRLEDVRCAFVLAIDDVGTKSKAPAVAPSYRLETSAGNYQWGYLIEPWDVSNPETAHFYDCCLVSLAAAGFNDPGFRSATRLARVPGSLHSSGFIAQVAEWAPQREWVLTELMEAFGVPMITGGLRRPRARAPGTVERIEDIDDPLYDWLAASGRVRGSNGDFVFIDCPWRAGHTDGKQGATATGFSPRGYGRYAERGFKCLHGHCSGYGIQDFKQWARSQGAIIDLPGGE